jgi:hypothetical protein
MPKKENQSLFQKLTKLFRSGPVVKRKLRSLDTTIAVPDKTKSSGALLFQKSMSPTYATITANAYNLSERLMRYQDFCFSGDTLVATPDEEGSARIDDIVRRWNEGDTNIWTFSFDILSKTIVSAKVTGAKCNGVKKVITVTLDDGSKIRCTPDHRFMLKDSSYVEAQNLLPGTALMRFSRANFSTPYRYVQTHGRGWKPEHVLVAEASAGRHCLDGEHVHHRNFKHRDNRPHNLEIMSAHDHMSLHAKINNLRFADPKERAKQSKIMKRRWQVDGDLRKNLQDTIEKCRDGNRQRRIFFNKTFKPGRFNSDRKDQVGCANGNADKDFSYQDVCNAFQQSDTIRSLSAKLGVSEYKIRRRLEWEGYASFSSWSATYENHKVVSVVDEEEFIDVYDIEVAGYSNFALAKKDVTLGSQGIVIVHNCEMEYCLQGETLIAVPGGYKRIDELAAECEGKPDHTFLVYSYDHNLRRIIPTLGKQARQTRVDEAYTVTFDNGKKITGTSNHRLMKRDGTFCKIEDLKTGDAMMPFYRRDLFSGCKEEGEGYRWIYTMDKRSSMNGWVTEHRVIGELLKGSPLEKGEVVHHKNFIKWDNNPSNLSVMTDEAHRKLHADIINGIKWSEHNAEWIQKFKANHSKFMSENNPAERKDITFGRILEVAERVNFNSRSMCEVLDTDPNVIKRRLRKHGYKDFQTFAKAYNPDWHNAGWDNQGEKNPRYVKSITFDRICSNFSKGMSNKQLADSLNTTVHVIESRIRGRGYKNYSEFASSYDNLKVTSVEYHGIIPLYDLTVDGYKNFATDTVISHNTPELAAAMDIYADETVAQDDKGRSLHIYSDNEKIREILEDLFYNTLNVEFNLRSWARNLVKYGDFFLYNDVSPTHGVVNAFPIPVNEIEREENFDPNDPMAVRYRWVTLGNRTMENWEVTHFRLLGNDMFLPYGSSIIEPARRIWRQLILIEDAMLVYRVVRAPERRVFYIDVANIPPENVPMYVEEQRKNLRSSQVVDRTTGRVDLRYNPLSVDEDYFIAVRGGDSGTKIDTLAGGQNTAAVEDVAYIQKKLFAALKIPRAYLGYDEALSSKATLAQEDIRFSRTINVIQKTLISELNKLAIIHLYANGFDEDDLQNFTLRLSNPSTVAQQQKLELWRSKFEIAGSAPEGQMSKEFIRKEIWGLNDEQCKQIDEQRLKEKMVDGAIESAKPEEDGAAAGGAETPPAGDDAGVEPAGGEEAAGEDLFAGDDPADDNNLDVLLSGDDPDDEESYPVKFKLTDVDIPVKPQSQLKKALYNRSRRRHHGPAKTHMPDFNKSLSSLGSMKDDPTDQNFRDSYVSNPLGESKTSLNRSISAALQKMSQSEKFKSSPMQPDRQVLSEDDRSREEDTFIDDGSDEE